MLSKSQGVYTHQRCGKQRTRIVLFRDDNEQCAVCCELSNDSMEIHFLCEKCEIRTCQRCYKPYFFIAPKAKLANEKSNPQPVEEKEKIVSWKAPERSLGKSWRKSDGNRVSRFYGYSVYHRSTDSPQKVTKVPLDTEKEKRKLLDAHAEKGHCTKIIINPSNYTWGSIELKHD